MKSGRVFFTGMAVGLLAGVFLSPIAIRSDFAGGAMGAVVAGMLANAQPRPPEASWPTGDEALVALFEFSNWPTGTEQAGSAAIVEDCLNVSDGLACQLTLNLTWVDALQHAEAIFNKSFDRWDMRSIRAVKPM